MKVLSYNILEGGGRRLGAIAGVIRSQQPDAVALLEANRRWNAIVLARELGMQLAFGKANSKFHVAWLSRLPIKRRENHRIPKLAKTILEIEVPWDGRPLRLFATHLAGGADAIHPAAEAPAILDILRPLADEPHLLVGDFNALHPDDPVGQSPIGSEAMRDSIDDDPRAAVGAILAAGYTDCFRALNPGAPGYTYPAGCPWLRLDYVFASPSMAARLEASAVVDCAEARQASDHLPVWAAFRYSAPVGLQGRRSSIQSSVPFVE